MVERMSSINHEVRFRMRNPLGLNPIALSRTYMSGISTPKGARWGEARLRACDGPGLGELRLCFSVLGERGFGRLARKEPKMQKGGAGMGLFETWRCRCHAGRSLAYLRLK